MLPLFKLVTIFFLDFSMVCSLVCVPLLSFISCSSVSISVPLYLKNVKALPEGSRIKAIFFKSVLISLIVVSNYFKLISLYTTFSTTSSFVSSITFGLTGALVAGFYTYTAGFFATLGSGFVATLGFSWVVFGLGLVLLFAAGGTGFFS